jgi:hypothetical protein
MKIEEDKRVLEEIRRQTRLGKPLGDEGFLETLSEKLDHSLIFRPKGSLCVPVYTAGPTFKAKRGV